MGFFSLGLLTGPVLEPSALGKRSAKALEDFSALSSARAIS